MNPSRRQSSPKVYAMNDKLAKHMKQKLKELKGELHKSTSIVGVFNIPLLTIDRTDRQNIRKNIEKLSNTINQQNLFHMNGTFHPTTAAHTFFSRTHRTFTKAIIWTIKQTSENLIELKIWQLYRNCSVTPRKSM